MQTLKFTINKQVIKWENPCRKPVEKSKGVVHAQFTFDEEWSGLNPTIVFDNDFAIKPVGVIWTGDPIQVPPEVLVQGRLRVSAMGFGDGGKTRLTTKRMEPPIMVFQSGPVETVGPEEATPELWEQVLALMGGLSNLNTDDESSLVAAINEVLAKVGAGGGGVSKEELTAAVNAALKQAKESGEFDGADGAPGKDGSDATVTTENIKNALGYTPADAETVSQLSEEIVDESTPEQETAPLGVELASASGWTTDGWTGSFAVGFTHTAGNTNPLIFTMPEATGTKLYLVQFTLDKDVDFEGSFEGNAQNGLWVQLGNSSYFDLYDEKSPYRCGIRSVSDGNLQFNVGSNYTGTISGISVKEITGTFAAPTSKKDSDGEVAYEVRPTKADQYNLFFGLDSGQYNVSGHDNVGVGAETLKNNTSGYRNAAVGHGAQEQMTVGSRNVAIGHLAMQKMVDGQRNVAIGNASMTNMPHGHRNIAIGADCMYGVHTATDDNIGIGYAAMYSCTGTHNIAIGHSALYQNTANKNIAIGRNALYKTTGGANVAIGENALYHKGAGQRNIAIGSDICAYGASNSTQEGNVLIGCKTASKLGIGNNNVFIGDSAGSDLTSGSRNILIGRNAQAPRAEQYYWINIGDVYQGSCESGKMYAWINGGLQVTGLPTSDPGIAGRFWNDGGTVKVSAGA